MSLIRLVGGGLSALLALAPTSAALRSRPVRGEYSVRVWKAQDGLPESRIVAISQTPDGYLWIGTSSGLARFDGVRFAVFTRLNTPELRDDSILCLHPARDGSLWVGTSGGGLLHYRNGSFHTLGTNEGLTNGWVRAIEEDRQGILWVGTDRGLSRLEDGRFQRLDDHLGVPFMSVADIHEDSDGRLWIGGTRGMMQVQAGKVNEAPFEGLGRLPVRTRFLETRAGKRYLWGAFGLLLLKDGRLYPQAWTRGTRLTALLEDSEGDLWAGAVAKGLICSHSGSPIRVPALNLLPDSTVTALFEDSQRSLWVGTLDGLVRLSKKTVRVLGKEDGLSDEYILSICEDRDSVVWAASSTGQLYRLKDGRAVRYALPVENFRAQTVFRDSRGSLWFGSSNRGIIRLSSGRATSYGVLDGLRSNLIRQFFEDRRGDIWIATGSGLSHWDGHKLKTYYLEDGLVYGSVQVITEDRAGDLLVGTENGANRLRDGKFVQDPLLAQVGAERVRAILEDSDGGLLLGTRGGGLFHVKRGKVTRLTTRDGLLSDSIFQLLEDRNGRIWMTGPAGISSVDHRELDALAEQGRGYLSVIAFGITEGLESSEMSGGVQPAGLKTRDGELWFPSVKGVVRVNPEQRRTPSPVPVLIESISVDERPIPMTGQVRIPPGRGRLEIRYTACDLLSPERIAFKYKLEGFDADWTSNTVRRVAQYTNLPPGSYRFRVAAIRSGAPLATSEASLSFVWDPRFRETGWFYALCAVLAAAFVRAGFLFYARQTAARYEALLGERARLAREMHDTVIQGCVGVSTLLEAASSLECSGTSEWNELLGQARTQIRLTLDEARQAVWDLRYGSFVGDLASTLPRLAGSLSVGKGVDLQTEISGDPAPLSARMDMNLLLVAREAMRNAVIHGAPQQILLRLAFNPREVRLEVADDGCGFDPSGVDLTDDGHYGIEGMRERVAQLGGSFQLCSGPGLGTDVVVRVPFSGHVRRDAPVGADHDQTR